jgi:integrase
MPTTTCQHTSGCNEPVAKGNIASCKKHSGLFIRTPNLPSGITTRGASYIAVTDINGRQVRTSHRTLALAKRAHGDRTGTHRVDPGTSVPFDKYAREWIDNYRGRTKRRFSDEDTRAAYRDALERFAIPHFGSRKLRDITRGDVRKLITKMEDKGLAPNSIQKYFAPVRALFADAVADSLLVGSPAEGVTVRSTVARTIEEAPEKRALTRAELAAFLDAIPDQWRLFFETLAYTGFRVSEVLGLQCGDLSWGGQGEPVVLSLKRQCYDGKIKPLKTDAARRKIVLPSEFGARLWAIAADRPATDLLFPSKVGTSLASRNMRRVFDAAAKKAGIDLHRGEGFHLLRRTHASMLVDAGWSFPDVAKRIGHTDAGFTAKTYVRALDDKQHSLDFLEAQGSGSDQETPGTTHNPGSPETAETLA